MKKSPALSLKRSLSSAKRVLGFEIVDWHSADGRRNMRTFDRAGLVNSVKLTKQQVGEEYDDSSTIASASRTTILHKSNIPDMKYIQ